MYIYIYIYIYPDSVHGNGFALAGVLGATASSSSLGLPHQLAANVLALGEKLVQSTAKDKAEFPCAIAAIEAKTLAFGTEGFDETAATCATVLAGEYSSHVKKNAARSCSIDPWFEEVVEVEPRAFEQTMPHIINSTATR